MNRILETRLRSTCILLSLCLSACFEPKEGCLDISATNFDASADNDCCCEYPKLVLTVNQVYDTLLFRNDALYADANGHLFRIKSVAFYLSDFKLTQNSVPYQVSDTLTLKTFMGNDTSSQLFVNDFQLVRRSLVLYEIGTFQLDGTFEQVAFRLGLSPEAQKVIPTKAPDGHPLEAQTDSLWRGQSQGFVFLQALVVQDTFPGTKADTIRIMEADLGQKFITATGSFNHPTGYDFPLVLKVDYKKLFDGINWSAHDIPAWKTKIISNLDAAFSVSQ